MFVKNIFIPGMPKCGTTALAKWMVDNGLAAYRVPGEKEPYLFSYHDDSLHSPLPQTDLPFLDASQYTVAPNAIQRMPEHGAHIVICLDNQFKQMWSTYKMYHLINSEAQDAKNYFHSFPSNKKPSPVKLLYLFANFFPRRSYPMIKTYMQRELEHVCSHDFSERVEYEIGFYLSRRSFPFFSILIGAFYYFQLRTLLAKYLPEDIFVVSVSKLKDSAARDRFVEGVFDKKVQTPEVPFFFSSEKIEFDQPKPDFNDKAFDSLRSFFRYDLAQARELIQKTRFADSLLDNEALDRYL